MKTELACSNVSFSFLSSSSDFLNLVLDNINCCILMLNNQMELQAFNNAMKTIFSNDKGSDLYRKCGEVIGCAYSVEEEKGCGTTSHCGNCELRLAAMSSYVNDQPISNDCITRPFYMAHNRKETKHLQFSTRIFNFKREKYILLIINDITELVNLREVNVIPNIEYMKE
jgi:hypothetical protein